MKILLALTYYRPHISGLTIYAERLAQALAARGHAVTVLTSQYDAQLPHQETHEGVRIVRVPVVLRISKGVIMPSFGLWATRLVLQHDVLSLHLPQFDAAGIALRGALLRKPVILTYHCDLQLPPGRFNRFVDRVVYAANHVSARFADQIVVNTQDYADHSQLLRPFKRKIAAIAPPVVMPAPSTEEIAQFKAAHNLNGRRTIGFAARFAAEKGIEYLIDAMPDLLRRYPDLKVLFVGPYRDVLGEEAYWQRLAPRIEQLGDHWQFLGTISADQLPAFFGALDCLLVTSVNSTESFGMVQVEAMLCGTPVVSTDRPGVRQPVEMTGMGQIVPAADSTALTAAIERVLDDRQAFVKPRVAIEARFDLQHTVDRYERVFEEQSRAKGRL